MDGNDLFAVRDVREPSISLSPSHHPHTHIHSLPITLQPQRRLVCAWLRYVAWRRWWHVAPSFVASVMGAGNVLGA